MNASPCTVTNPMARLQRRRNLRAREDARVREEQGYFGQDLDDDVEHLEGVEAFQKEDSVIRVDIPVMTSEALLRRCRGQSLVLPFGLCGRKLTSDLQCRSTNNEDRSCHSRPIIGPNLATHEKPARRLQYQKR